MASVRLNENALAAIAERSDGSMKELRKVAFEIKRSALEVYLSQRVMPDHNTYAKSFEVYRSGYSYIITNTDNTAFWVEFGAHAGGKTAVLGYAPLRTAVDIISSYQ